jgi:release factor glutamine methyltransferase
MEKEISWLLKEKYNGKLTKKFYKDAKRIKKGEPADYVIGFAEFLGCKIDLSKKPLIPRKETEYWTAYAAGDIKKRIDNSSEILRILDVFSGSGCIGIAIQANVPNVLCDFAEKDEKLIRQIKINLKNNFITPPKCKVIRSDIFSKVKTKYDYILANPPYIPAKNKNKIQKSVLKYEPKQAIFGGEDGLKYIEKFLKQAKNHLKKYGRIYMEFDSEQKNKIERLLLKYKYKKWWFAKDQYNRWRWVVVEV